jgi:hypothetical protein
MLLPCRMVVRSKTGPEEEQVRFLVNVFIYPIFPVCSIYKYHFPLISAIVQAARKSVDIPLLLLSLRGFPTYSQIN